METSMLGVRRFPVDLHRDVKVAAAKEGITLQEWFVRACKEKLERDAKN